MGVGVSVCGNVSVCEKGMSRSVCGGGWVVVRGLPWHDVGDAVPLGITV